jgi:hypothetical protein
MDLGFTIISEGTLVVAISIVMALELAAALAASKRRTGLVLTPVTFFFVYAVIHVLFGRYAALLLASKYTFVGPATFEPFVNQAFFIISTGLMCSLLAYLLVPCGSSGRISRLLVRISSKEALDKLFVRSRLLIVISIPLIIFGLQQLGGIPLLSDNLRHDRYLLNFTSEHRLDTFLVNRGREFIVFPAAALALGWFLKKRRITDLLFVAAAAVSALLTATRSPLLIGMSIVMMVLVWRNEFKAVVLTVVAVLAALLASEIVLGGDANTASDEWTVIQRIGADVAEVRDLAWTLSRQDELFWGRTFLAGLVPVPAFATDFTQTYHLRTITLEAIHIPLSAGHGGLRITYSGEWFINFGWPGVVIGGFLYGWMCSWFSAIFHHLRSASALYPVGTFLAACAWVALSFMVYISSSGAGGTLKTYVAVLLLLGFGLRLRRARRFEIVPLHEPIVSQGYR